MFDPSLGIIVKLFPLLLPIWTERPIVLADIYPEPYQSSASAEQVAFQRQAFRHGDYTQRATVARQLAESGRREAFDLLLEQLRRESESIVIAVLLQQLAGMPYGDKACVELTEPLLFHPDVDVRYWATRLRGRLDDADTGSLLRLLERETDSRIRRAAAREIAGRDDAELAPLLNDADPAVRTTVVRRGVSRHPDLWPAAAERALSGDEPAAFRLAVAETASTATGADTGAVLAALALDSSTLVRGAVAAALARVQPPTAAELLRGLRHDLDPEVRRQAATALAGFPDAATVAALVGGFDDDANLVRAACEDALTVIHARLPVWDAVAEALDRERAACRCRVYRTLGRTQAVGYADAVAARLAAETDVEALSGVVRALGLLQVRGQAGAIARLARHPEARVRREVAESLGRLNVADTLATLATLVFDPDPEVRGAAIVAAARTRNGTVFSPTMLAVLLDVTDAKVTATDRAAACWAAARLTPLSLALADRLVEHATTTVIPSEETVEFDSDDVLISAAFALAQQGHNDTAIRAKALTVIRKHGYQPVEPESPGSKVEPIGVSAEVAEYARQAYAVMTGTTVEARPRPTTRIGWIYGRLQSDRD